MSSYLLIYNRRTGQLRHEEFVGDQGRKAAMRRRLEVEKSRPSADIEVVVLAAESLDQIKHTHGRYFSSTSDLVRDAISEGHGDAVALA